MSWLRKPYPCLYLNARIRIWVSLGVFGFVTLFILVFKPFNIEQLSSFPVWQTSIIYGLTSSSITYFFMELVVRLFPNYFQENSWTIGKEFFVVNILMIFIAIGNFVMGRTIELYQVPKDSVILLDFYNDVVHTYAIGIFPVTFLIVLDYVVKLRRNLNHSEKNNLQIQEKKQVAYPEPNVEIEITNAERQKLFDCKLNELLFVMADGNYTEFHLFNGQAKREIHRTTLSHIAHQLNQHPQFFRSHRAFIVNMNKVVESNGNAQGYQLKLENTEQIVPVSRGNLAAFDQLIKG